jgi:apolipoprotein N-acyltransferase
MAEPTPPPTDGASPSPTRAWLPFALAALSGTLHFLSFCGFGLWPLAFVCFLPLYFALEHPSVVTKRRAAAVGFTHGFVAYLGGYHWMAKMLEVFSGFNIGIASFLASFFWAYLALLQLVLALCLRRARHHGYPVALAAVAFILCLEQWFPTLFPSHFGYAFFDQTWLLQLADLGGPGVVGALPLLIQAALYPLVRDRLSGQSLTLHAARPLLASIALLLLGLGYGAWRTQEVDARVARAETLHVGIVQAAMGVFEKHLYPQRGHRLHLEGSRSLEASQRAAGHPLDLLVWPESAYLWTLPPNANLERVLRDLTTPLLFGGLRRDMDQDGQMGFFNTAYLIDAQAQLLGTYDKTYLLAFGEYLPLGETFPQLYELSPRTGRLSPGTHTRPLVLPGSSGDTRITTLICYEDVLPGFTRQAVAAGQPHLLVNITNDAWFGKSQEPHIHLAMARFRAAEHHRALVRSTNSGVSAFIDPAGRVVTHGGLFTGEQLHARVPRMDQATLYETVGDWPAWLATVASLGMLLRRRRVRAA